MNLPPQELPCEAAGVYPTIVEWRKLTGKGRAEVLDRALATKHTLGPHCASCHAAAKGCLEMRRALRDMQLDKVEEPMDLTPLRNDEVISLAIFCEVLARKIQAFWDSLALYLEANPGRFRGNDRSGPRLVAIRKAVRTVDGRALEAAVGTGVERETVERLFEMDVEDLYAIVRQRWPKSSGGILQRFQEDAKRSGGARKWSKLKIEVRGPKESPTEDESDG